MNFFLIARTTAAATVMTAVGLIGCGNSNEHHPSQDTDAAAASPSASPPTSLGENTVTSNPPLSVKTLNAQLERPWGLAFLPDASLLVSQKNGSLLHLNPQGEPITTLKGLPPVVVNAQGGLLDVAVAPDFAQDPWVYWTYAEAGTGDQAQLTGTAVARGRLVGDTLTEVAVIFRQQPKVTGGGHFGARLAFAHDGRLFVTLGERQKDDPAQPGLEHAQNPGSHLGKIVRLERDGTVPADNPKLPGGAPGIWSLGHRNVQGATVHPQTGELWVSEHGPQGGDEINQVRAGHNYGWPIASYGCPYGAPVGAACRVRGGRHAPEFTAPVSTWVPTSQAPSGLMVYTGERFPAWKGHFFTGALSGQMLWRLDIRDGREIAREPLLQSLQERIRDVKQGPDGWLYLLTDSGKLLQVTHE